MYRLLLLSALIVLASCNTTRVIKPLEKGEKQIGASFGGPGIIYAGVPLPLPMTSISYAQGLDTGLTLAAGLHTSALLFGDAEVDLSLGIKVYASKSERFGLTASPGVHLLYGFRGNDFRAYPQLEGIGWWQYGEKNHLLYGGLGTWIELVREKAHGEVQDNELMPYLTLGHQFAGEKWQWQAEARYIGFNYSNDNIVVDYIGPFPNGTTGLYVGVTRKIGKK